jgi:hypothetical protein
MYQIPLESKDIRVIGYGYNYNLVGETTSDVSRDDTVINFLADERRSMCINMFLSKRHTRINRIHCTWDRRYLNDISEKTIRR